MEAGKWELFFLYNWITGGSLVQRGLNYVIILGEVGENMPMTGTGDLNREVKKGIVG